MLKFQIDWMNTFGDMAIQSLDPLTGLREYSVQIFYAFLDFPSHSEHFSIFTPSPRPPPREQKDRN